MPFENTNQQLTGNITAVVLDPAGVPASTVIRAIDPWQVRVDWNITGGLAIFVDSNMEWVVRVFLESMGPGPEIQANIPTMTVPATGGFNQVYNRLIQIPGNAALAGAGASGVYKVVTVLTLRKIGTNSPLPIAGYSEGPVVQFFA